MVLEIYIFFPPLIGGAIGWLTNAIAIWMLFHPYREYRVFGLKLPFTPGLIPSRINELAEEHLKSVRELARENEEVFYVLTGCNPDEFFEQKRYLPGEERVGENVDFIFRAKAKKGKAESMIFDLWYKNGLPLRGSPLL